MRRLVILAALLAAPGAALAQSSPSAYTSGTRYDAVGHVTGTISADPDALGSGLPFLAVRNSYDGAGRLIKVETGTLSTWQSEGVAPSAWGSAFSVGHSLETQYDAVGHKIRDTLREGSAGTVRTVTQYSYDSVGRLECTALRMNPAVFGSLPSSACTLGTEGADGPDRITKMVYDAAGERVQLREGVGTAIEATEATWAYNDAGQVTTVIDGNGNRASLHYDGFGRQDSWIFPSTTAPTAYNDATQASALASAGSVNAGDHEDYSYDSNGNRTDLRKRDGRHIAYAYDALNRVTSKTYPQGGATPVYYGYDNRNLQTFAHFTSSSGAGVTNSYDGFGRLVSSSIDMAGTTRTLTYGYDRDGNRTWLGHPDGTAFASYFDNLDRLVMTMSGASAYIYTVFRPDGARQAFGTPAASVGYDYDGVGRPSAMMDDFAGSSADANWSYARNAAGGLRAVTRDNDSYAWTGHYAVNRGYTTNGLNQYSAAGGASFTYDANGNLTSDGTRTYTYDIENRLTASSNGAALSYDPLGRLAQVTLGSATTRFLYDGDALVAEYNGSNVMTTRHLHAAGADVPMVTFSGTNLSSPHFLYTDHQGSIIAAADGSGNRVATGTYDEYGIPGAANTGRFQYTGQIWLGEMGLYYYKARLYTPTLGRFMQTDPVGYQDQSNLYAYVGNDPVNLTDPSGMVRNCAPNDQNCIETPESAQQPGDPPPPSPEEIEAQTVIVTGHRPPIDYSGDQETFFIIDNHVMTPRPMVWHDVHCPGGASMNVGTTAAVPPGTIPAHAHGDGLEQHPGPRDDNAALHATGHVAAMMTRDRSFTIRAFPNGTFRTRQTEGPPLNDSDRAGLVEVMRNWEHHPDPGPSQPLAARVCQ